LRGEVAERVRELVKQTRGAVEKLVDEGVVSKKICANFGKCTAEFCAE